MTKPQASCKRCEAELEACNDAIAEYEEEIEQKDRMIHALNVALSDARTQSDSNYNLLCGLVIANAGDVKISTDIWNAVINKEPAVDVSSDNSGVTLRIKYVD